MNKLLTEIPLLLILTLVLSLPIAADQEYLEVDSYDSLEIGTGMEGIVSCGSKNTVTLFGNKKDLDHIEVNVQAGKLEISRRTSAGKILHNLFRKDGGNNSVRAEITTVGQLSNIDASTGSSLTIPGCAVNNSLIRIDAGTGAMVNIEGNTGTVELDLSTGSIFNQGGGHFTADIAEVDISTGAIADLCGAKTISGSASTGAMISAADNADTEAVSLSTGASVSKKSCR